MSDEMTTEEYVKALEAQIEYLIANKPVTANERIFILQEQFKRLIETMNQQIIEMSLMQSQQTMEGMDEEISIFKEQMAIKLKALSAQITELYDKL